MLDTNKLFKIITNDPELGNVPIFHIMLVATSVIKAINSGECLSDIWED